MVLVTKFDGRKEEFDKEKIIRTCLRVGIDREIAISIAEKIQGSIYDGMTTKEIYQNLLKELRTVEKKSAIAYSIRELVAHLDPFVFEIYVKKILESHGYKCEYNKLIEGVCVEHQVDIIATSDEKYLVECKRHANPHRFCGLGTVLQVFARFQDIHDGFENKKNIHNFNRAWIITNTKFSDHAKQYANAKNIRMTGWNYPQGEGIERMIDEKRIYPVSVLKAKKPVIDNLFCKNIITLFDLDEISLRSAGIDEKISSNLMEQKRRILSS